MIIICTTVCYQTLAVVIIIINISESAVMGLGSVRKGKCLFLVTATFCDNKRLNWASNGKLAKLLANSSHMTNSDLLLSAEAWPGLGSPVSLRIKAEP